jgi:hypothetical protein
MLLAQHEIENKYKKKNWNQQMKHKLPLNLWGNDAVMQAKSETINYS